MNKPQVRSRVVSYIFAGFSTDAIVDECATNNAERAEVIAEIYSARNALVRRENLQKMEKSKAIWMQAVMRGIRNHETAIAEEPNLIPEDFHRRYYSRNEPAIFRRLLERWADFSPFTFASLRQKFGECEVEVMTDRTDDTQYDLNPRAERIRLGAFLDKAENTVGNDQYMVAANQALLRGGLEGLFQNIPAMDGVLDTTNAAGAIFLWIGPTGTISPLHHDTSNVLLTQVQGSKKITMIPPEETPFVYNLSGSFAEVNAESPDLKLHPLFAHAHPRVCTLNEGDALFIPVGWWHHVRGLAPSVSIGFNNFVWPNFFPREWF